ncbi:MAG: STM3941 family protein [Syntrophorhabdales bacterium]|jgi:hypothetical protein
MNDEIILRPSRVKWFSVLLIGLVFVIAGALGASHPSKGSDFWVGCLCIAFSGLMVIVSIVQLFPGHSFLKIGIQGIQFRALRRTYIFSWSDVEEFGLCEYTIYSYPAIPLNRKKIGLRMSPAYVQSLNYGSFKEMCKSIYGYDLYLPDNYGMRSEKLAKLLNDKRRQYIGNG